MASKANSLLSFSRFGFGFGSKSQSSRRRDGDGQGDEQWYIPYNGPYELPKDIPKTGSGSWSHLVDGAEPDDVLGDRDVFRRYGPPNEMPSTASRSLQAEEYTRNRSRGRAVSDATRHTTSSSGVLDPSWRLTSRSRRSTHSHTRPGAPSFVNLDTGGGVGESPMPAQRSPPSISGHPYATGGKPSVSGFVSFTATNRKSSQPLSPSRLPDASQGSKTTSPPTPSSTQTRGGKSRTYPPRIQTVREQTSDMADANEYYNSYYSTLLVTPKSHNTFHPSHSRPDILEKSSSDLIPQRYPHNGPSGHPGPPTSYAHGSQRNIASSSKQITHPYAYSSSYTFPGAREEKPHASESAALSERVFDSDTSPHHHRDTSQQSASGSRFLEIPESPALPLSPSAYRKNSFLKTYTSTPNLRNVVRSETPRIRSRPPIARGIERWLSAETWCDAIIFPRPRFKVKQGADTVRILSPPGSPLPRIAPTEASDDGVGQRPPLRERKTSVYQLVHDGLRQRRGLTKSRSAADLLRAPSRPDLPNTSQSSHAPPDANNIGGKSRDTPPLGDRPLFRKSFAQDDLALPSPVPSLAKVLAEGEELQKQRRMWQYQASHSFANKSTRSVSRSHGTSRQKSQFRSRADSGGKALLGSIDYLAARTLLGSQTVAPIVHVKANGTTSTSNRSTLSRSQTTTGTHSHSRSLSQPYTHSHSHSHSHSLAPTVSHSHSQPCTDPQCTGCSGSFKLTKDSHKRSHARNESWGKSALKMATGICGIQRHDSSPGVANGEEVDSSEQALRAEDSRIIQLPDPAHASNEPQEYGACASDGISPTPTAPSGQAVGIAISSPQPSDDHSRQNYDLESISMPDHPYAQVPISQYAATPLIDPHLEHAHAQQLSEYAGPHPSTLETSSFPAKPDTNDVATRHRLPPHAMTQSIRHPYATASHSHSANSGNQKQTLDLSQNSDVGSSQANTLPIANKIGHKPFSQMSLDSKRIEEALIYALRDKSRVDSGFWAVEDRTGALVEGSNHQVAEEVDSSRQLKSSDPPASSLPRHSEDFLHFAPSEALIVENNFSGEAGKGAESISEGSNLFFVTPLDDYQNLFYEPQSGQSGDSMETKTAEEVSVLSRGVSSDVASTRSESGLTNLVRQLSVKLDELHDRESLKGGTPVMRGQRLGGLRGQRPLDFPNPHGFIFSEMTASASSSPVPLDQTAFQISESHSSVPILQLEPNVPEDVESSRASSPLERFDEENDTFGYPIRLGHVEALAPSPVVNNSQRVSSHISIMNDQNDFIAQSNSNHNSTLISPASLQLPSSDPTRSSYMTSASDQSAMSGLSDFPSPPAHTTLTPAHMSILQSYFDATPSTQQDDPIATMRAPQPPYASRPGSNHTTFGGSEDMEFITRVHRSAL